MGRIVQKYGGASVRDFRAIAVRSGLALAASVLLVWAASGCQDTERTAKKAGVITAKFASEEIEGDFMTVWAEKFAAHMKQVTGGKLDITVYPYGSLGGTRDINELAQLGVVDFVFTDFAWISSFVPQAQVLALHYVWPKENAPEVLAWVVKNGEFMPKLEEAFRKKKLVPLAIMYEGWQWITSKEETRTLDELQGLKVRLMGSKILIENYRAYGVSPTPMSYGEVYSALQTGLIDAQVNPLFANYSMKFYEVTHYFTQMWAEPFLGIPTANLEFFESLSPETQQQLKDYFSTHILEAAAWIDARNQHDRALIEKERPSIVWSEWDDREIARAEKQVRDIRTTVYPELTGEDAADLLETLLGDIENAQKALAAEPRQK